MLRFQKRESVEESSIPNQAISSVVFSAIDALESLIHIA